MSYQMYLLLDMSLIFITLMGFIVAK